MCNAKKEIRDFDSYFELIEYFTTEDICIEYLANLRWGGNAVCPHCGEEKCYELNVTGRPKRWKCSSCRKQFSVTVGTIFENSKIPLRKWFFATYLFSAHKKGISSHQLARDLKLTQKSAWFVLQRLRKASNKTLDVFTGSCEVDETYVGGKEKNKHESKKVKGTQGRSTKTKTPVLGIIERENGRVFATTVSSTEGDVILPIMRERVQSGSVIFSDEWRPYRKLRRDYQHEYVNHGSKEYVKGNAYTNNIECFWSHFKRGIIGIYHNVSPKHLDRYVNEFTFRFNNREISDGERFDNLLVNTNKRLKYKDLINA